MVVNSGVLKSIHQNCHHQIVFAKVNLKVSYPSPYTQRIWDYSKANYAAINNTIDSFDWEKDFSNVNPKTAGEVNLTQFLVTKKLMTSAYNR